MHAQFDALAATRQIYFACLYGAGDNRVTLNRQAQNP
jgi:hypothetical protein